MEPTATVFGYWVGAGVALTLFLHGGIAPAAKEAVGARAGRMPRVGPKIFAAAMVAVLMAFRWPVIFNPRNAGIDEGLWIGGTLTLFKDPIFWRGVDGDSAGPLVFYALMPLGPLGLLNFAGIKLAATLLLWAALWFSYAGLRAVWGDALARLGVLPAACFFAFETRLEFVSYSTEHVTLLLLAAGWWGVLRAVARPESLGPELGPWIVAGSALGAVPFAKLQGVPMAGLLVAAALAWAVTRRTWTARRRVGAIATFAAAVCFVPLVFSLMLTAGLKWEDFWIPWIELNRARSAGAFGVDAAGGFLAWQFIAQTRLFQVLLFGAPLVAVAAVLARPQWRGARAWAAVVSIGLLGVSVAAALVPAYSFHHLHFLVLPLALMAASTLAMGWSLPTGEPEWRRRGLLAVILMVLVVPQVALWLRRGNAGVPATPPSLRVETGPLALEILRRAGADDRLIVWGTQHVLHAQTGLAQGTREANPRIPVVPPRFRDYYRRRYLADWERSRARFFVDQTSARPEDARLRARWGHEADPEVRDYVARHYDYMGEFEGMRLYVRKAGDV